MEDIKRSIHVQHIGNGEVVDKRNGIYVKIVMFPTFKERLRFLFGGRINSLARVDIAENPKEKGLTPLRVSEQKIWIS